MKKLLITFILISKICYISLALPSLLEEEHDNLTGNIGISFLHPVDKNLTGSDKFLSSFLLSSFSVGFGYHLNIVENIFSPGIYGDLHLNILPTLFLLSGLIPKDDIKDIENYEKVNGTDPFVVLQTGIRIYNQFRFNLFDFQPFVGINLISGSIDFMVLRMCGILIAYKYFGIEYSYQQPISNHINNHNGSIHRIVFTFHIR
jgi:hypothetical protein